MNHPKLGKCSSFWFFAAFQMRLRASETQPFLILCVVNIRMASVYGVRSALVRDAFGVEHIWYDLGRICERACISP